MHRSTCGVCGLGIHMGSDADMLCTVTVARVHWWHAQRAERSCHVGLKAFFSESGIMQLWLLRLSVGLKASFQGSSGRPQAEAPRDRRG